jgi:MFS superfamily sulfate permease-like transporter
MPLALGPMAPGLEAFRHYDAANLRSDVFAGLSVEAAALPSGIAYTDIAKVPPVAGIHSAIFPLFAYAFLVRPAN